MTSFYSIIKYVPNRIADEHINVGMIFFNEEKCFVEISNQISRAKKFGINDGKLNDLKNALGDIKNRLASDNFNKSVFEKLLDQSIYSIQLTQPTKSLQSIGELKESILPLFLPYETIGQELQLSSIQHFGKRHIGKLAKESLRAELKAKFELPGKFINSIVKSNYQVRGNYRNSHDTDIAIVNGIVRGAALSIHLSNTNAREISEDLNSAAFKFQDIKKQSKDLPLYMLGYQHGATKEVIEEATHLMSRLDIPLISEDKVDGWAREFVSQLPDDCFAGHEA